jgi:hypothetical protein
MKRSLVALFIVLAQGTALGAPLLECKAAKDGWKADFSWDTGGKGQLTVSPPGNRQKHVCDLKLYELTFQPTAAVSGLQVALNRLDCRPALSKETAEEILPGVGLIVDLDRKKNPTSTVFQFLRRHQTGPCEMKQFDFAAIRVESERWQPPK